MLQRALGLRAPEAVCGDLDGPEGVALGPRLHRESKAGSDSPPRRAEVAVSQRKTTPPLSDEDARTPSAESATAKTSSLCSRNVAASFASGRRHTFTVMSL